MRQFIAIILSVMMCAAPLAAQSEVEDVDEGLSLLEQGAKIIMRSMLEEVEPALKDLKNEFGDAVAGMGPILRDLVAQIGDIRNYHPPVKLPNGDILLRRKTPAEMDPPMPGGEIDI